MRFLIPFLFFGYIIGVVLGFVPPERKEAMNNYQSQLKTDHDTIAKLIQTHQDMPSEEIPWSMRITRQIYLQLLLDAFLILDALIKNLS